MAPSRTRSPSLSKDERAPKRVKTSVKETSVAGHFYPGLLNPENTEALRVQYAKSEPFLHGVIDKLFDETLLRNASEEILREISFTVKETDIYKVHQTGDLASLSYLTPEQLSLFPSLLTLRNALYSPEFRSYVRKVTGCGPLSGNKQDMSVNSYRKGCHLLNHDDVIGSRRVSYILYMPLPLGEDWKAEYGGALELYPMLESVEDAAAEGRLPEPATVPSKIIPPSWNQFVFFEIQPGKSFHSVEEVVVDLDEHGRQRLSISGWFHKPQPGEEGYAEEDDAIDRLKSSLEQLSEAPPPPMKEYTSEDMQPVLSTEDRAFLARFINEAYLSPANMPAIVNSFAENSEIQLQRFLRPPLARRLQAGLQACDREDKLSISERPRSAIPPHTSGATTRGPWSIHGPPHKQRFCALVEGKGKNKLPSLPADDALDEVDVDTLLLILQNSLFSSDAFRAWLALLSGLIPLKYQLASRRFRPGLDYTLATAHEEDARLDVVLDLTPEPEASSSNGKSAKKAQGGPTGWQSGEWGGWLCYMAPDEGEEDPAVYRSSSSKKNDHRVNGTGHSGHSTGSSDGNGPAEVSDDEGEEQEEDSTLLTVQPAFNRLLLTLRDARVLHFVKYVSASAHGSRWDICGEWEVGMVADSDDDETHDGQ